MPLNILLLGFENSGRIIVWCKKDIRLSWQILTL